jgi:hypothetical protein
MKRISFRLIGVAFLTALALGTAMDLFQPLAAQSDPVKTNDKPRKGGKGGQGKGEVKMPTPAFRTEVPAHEYDMILGRPTKESITLSVLTYGEREGYVAYGTKPGEYAKETPKQKFLKGQPVELLINGLAANTRYYYRFCSRVVGKGDFERSAEANFMTARPPGSAFTFTVQADPHLDFATDPEVYLRSLTNAIVSGTDFHIDLGDTFMTDKYTDYKASADQYLAQRYYFGVVGRFAPVYLVLGNHDGEAGWFLDGGRENAAIWSNEMRKRYFPNPLPNNFYTGNQVPDSQAGLLENYYAWQWGDALFIALDPFWYTRNKSRGDDNWNRTLGDAQYAWLKKTLETSTAKYRFVFLHHLVGGSSKEARGGVEAAKFFEWGGFSLNGQNEFATKRPGWAMPIHQLLVKHRVNVVFHGHDHLFVKQELDGVIYQEVPQPGHPRGTTRSAEEYGYKSGVILPASGIMRVKVSPENAVVQYLKTGKEMEVAHEYVVKGR